MSDEACRLKSRMSSKLWPSDAMCWSPPRRTLLVRIVRRASSESVLALCGVHRKRRSSLHLDLRARRSAASGPLFRARTYGGVTPSVLPLRTVMTRRPSISECRSTAAHWRVSPSRWPSVQLTLIEGDRGRTVGEPRESANVTLRFEARETMLHGHVA
jgi:hypothetical protein